MLCIFVSLLDGGCLYCYFHDIFLLLLITRGTPLSSLACLNMVACLEVLMALLSVSLYTEIYTYVTLY
jgi:hypothetical protein